MNGSVIHLRKAAIIRPPRAETAVTAPPAKDAPLFESSLIETLAIKRFLGFALADIKYQLQMMAADQTMAKRYFRENKQAALLISEYLIGLIKDIDENLSTMQTLAEDRPNDPQGAA